MTEMLDTHPFPQHCINCGHKFTHTSSMFHDTPPSSGDVMICIDCQHVMIVDTNNQLREPTDKELVEIAGGAELVGTQRAIARAKSAGKNRQGRGP